MLRARQEDTESHERERTADQADVNQPPDQPRPALGRRPWFALLRRARSLRRFALAIRPESVARSRRFVTVASRNGSWVAGGVLLAESAMDRRRGVLIAAPRVLLRTRCVHSFALRRPLRVVGIDRWGHVRVQRVLQPRRLHVLRDVAWTLELPITDPGPELGEQLNIYARRCEWQADSLWNADRQSW